MKEKQPNIFKRWYKLCEPNKLTWAMQIITYAGYSVISALMAIFAAKTINCLYNHDWTGAYIWLAVELGDIIARNLIYHIEYYFYGKIHGQINKTLSGKIYDKIMSVNPADLKKFSAEKIISIATSNTGYACEFPDYVASMFSKIVYIVVALVAVFSSSWFAGIVVLLVAVFNYVVYNLAYKKMGRHLNRQFEAKDGCFREYSRVIAAKDVITELGAENEYKQKVLKHIDQYNTEYSKYYMTQSFKDNAYYAIWNVLVYAITAVLVYLVSKNVFDIALYIMVVPYLTSTTETFNELYNKIGGIESMRVDVDRLNLILTLDDKQLISYGSVNDVCEGYNLGFVNVSCTSDNPKEPKLKDISLAFDMHSINIVRGERGSGKRIIFDILRRQVAPTSGVVLLDNLNLFDYSPKTFKNHIDYCAQHPLFINGTIRENLQATNRDLSKLDDLIAELGLTQVIQRLPSGLDTQIEDVQDSETRFWIGIIRAALSKCKILMLYEYPDTDNPEFHAIFQNIIKTCETDKRTLILFTHNSDHDSLASTIFEVNSGKVTKVK